MKHEASLVIKWGQVITFLGEPHTGNIFSFSLITIFKYNISLITICNAGAGKLKFILTIVRKVKMYNIFEWQEATFW